MKLKDIKVGEDYAVGSDTYSQRATVVEVGVHGRVMHGFHSLPSTHANYVKVRFSNGISQTVVSRSVLRPWSEQEVVNSKRAVKRAERNAERDRVKRLHAAAPDLLEALKALADDHEHGATGTLRQDHLRAARAAIAKATNDA